MEMIHHPLLALSVLDAEVNVSKRNLKTTKMIYWLSMNLQWNVLAARERKRTVKVNPIQVPNVVEVFVGLTKMRTITRANNNYSHCCYYVPCTVTVKNTEMHAIHKRGNLTTKGDYSSTKKKGKMKNFNFTQGTFWNPEPYFKNRNISNSIETYQFNNKNRKQVTMVLLSWKSKG